MASTAAKTTMTILALLAVAGCGGRNEQERRFERASYERSAARICAAIRAKITPRREPAGPAALKRYVVRAAEQTREGARRLHDLRAKLADSEPSEVATFDDRIDAVVDATQQLEDATRRLPFTPLTQAQADSASAPAQRTRRAFASLYGAARSARLDGCGRGGNRFADTVLLSLYRDRLGSINEVSSRALRRVPSASQTVSRARVQRELLRIDIADLRRLRRLEVPSTLRRLHALQLRLDAEVVRLGRRVLALLVRSTPRSLAEAGALSRRQVRVLRRGSTVIRRMERIAGVRL